MLDAGRLDRRFRPREPTWTGRVCAAPIGGSPSARMPDGPRPRLGRGPSPGAGLHLLNGGACGNLRPCAPMPRAAARRTPHEARSTKHEARSTKHEARSTKHEARSTKHEARSTPRRACPGDVESVSSTRRASRFRWTANRRVAESRLRGAREPVGRSGDRTESKAKSAAEAAPGIGAAADAVSAPQASPRRTPEPRAEAASLPVTAAESACRPARARRSRCFSGCPSRSGRCRSGRRACCASCRRRARRAAS
ncbi:succinylglutamate desuccinylase/aspartoacylase family domain protein [Burkholderia pseudomallei MSHR511]|nr:succinylglutamate desuccinylase/aspartoacylase family domain protein [Burkholderia pseudomallei MSHR511]